MAELVDASDSKSGTRKGVQVRFLFWALGFQSIKKAAVSLPFFICKQFANKLLAEVRKNFVYLKVIQILILIKSHHKIGDLSMLLEFRSGIVRSIFRSAIPC